MALESQAKGDDEVQTLRSELERTQADLESAHVKALQAEVQMKEAQYAAAQNEASQRQVVRPRACCLAYHARTCLQRAALLTKHYVNAYLATQLSLLCSVACSNNL